MTSPPDGQLRTADDQVIDLRESVSAELAQARTFFDSKRVAIVHYGEHTPLDPGYRPSRMGLLATWLTEAGASVTRFVPTYSPFLKLQRDLRWTGTTSGEGDLIMVPVRAFAGTRSVARAGNIRDLARGVARALQADSAYDLCIVGYPPPGVLTAVHNALEGELPLVADIRDLWPDALVPSANRYVSGIASMIGTTLANELRFTSGVVASSHDLLQRAPASKRLGVIPLGLTATELPQIQPRIANPMVALFVGSLSHLFDFDSFIEGWSRFIARYSDAGHELRIVGDGVAGDRVRALAAHVPGVEFTGWVRSDEVPQHLVAADVGCHPVRPGQGITLGNKAFEYLSAGLHVLHSLEEGPARSIANFGSVIDSDPGAWADAFEESLLQLPDLRTSRVDRIEAATEQFGRSRTELLWLTMLQRALTGAPITVA